jgi:hypothetical protein
VSLQVIFTRFSALFDDKLEEETRRPVACLPQNYPEDLKISD